MSTPTDSSPAPRVAPPLRIPPSPPRAMGVGWIYFVGFLATCALLIELGTHLWGAVVFDPIPTWWHAAAVATVPLALFIAAWRSTDDESGHERRISRRFIHFQAFSIGVALCYTLAFLSVAPIVGICLLFVVGLFPLSPLLALPTALRVRGYLCRRYEFEAPGRKAPSWRPGFFAAVVLLGLHFGQDVYTRHLLVVAQSKDPAASLRALKKLRWFGSETTMLNACYGFGNSDFEFAKWMPTPAFLDARTTYYRVTGVPFESLSMPRRVASQLGGREWIVDFGLGGNAVAGKIRGLSLENSRLDGQFNAAAALAYTEWTMVFKNSAFTPNEARAQVELPPGGVVSRVTLWINGEPCEAAFGGRSQVRAAYQEVAVVQRRDPILVTTSGPDRVLVQCFPVPARGEMKIRVGITAPLVLQAGGGAALPLPRFLETNFDDENVSHQLWYDSDVPVSLGDKLAGKTVHLPLPEAALRRGAALRAQLPPKAGDVFTPDPSDPQFAIRQKLEQRPAQKPASVVFVVDGSKLAGSFHREIADALASLPDGLPFHVALAGDETSSAWEGLRPADAESRALAASWLGKAWARGGADNLDALIRAWDLASQAPGSALVWLHGPQPVVLGDFEALLQRIERDRNPPLLLTAALGGGPNRIAEKLDSFSGLHSIERQDSVGESLRQLFSQWSGKAAAPLAVRARVPAAEIAPETPKVDQHLARLWGREEVARLRSASPAATEAATKLAVDLQLVTPLSGAVVLESKAQYDRHGLKPGDSDTVPMIPEPATALLLSLGAGGLLFRRRRPSLVRV